MGRLLFDEATGNCLKEISGAAINDLPGSVEMTRPPGLEGVPLRLLTLTGGIVTQRAETPEEIAAKEESIYQGALLRGVARVLFNHENRIRVLEGKAPITAEQFKDAVKVILGL